MELSDKLAAGRLLETHLADIRHWLGQWICFCSQTTRWHTRCNSSVMFYMRTLCAAATFVGVSRMNEARTSFVPSRRQGLETGASRLGKADT